MAGYWNRPEETSGTLRDHVDEGGTRRWLHTGDLGYLDSDGYLFIVDRKKDIYKNVKGQTIAPAKIENISNGAASAAFRPQSKPLDEPTRHGIFLIDIGDDATRTRC